MPEKRNKSISHPIVDIPICAQCQKNELPFFDPLCPGCEEILSNVDTSISSIFAIVRQWVPQVQQNLEKFVNEIMRRGCGINDRDGLTDMTLLHYACKSGAVGVGNMDSAASLVTELISQGADLSLRCRWTDMLPVHYAAFFNCTPVIRILLKASGCRDIDATSSGFDNGSILHIAASNLCLEAAKCLLQHGANAFAKDDKRRTPLNTIPEANTFERSSPSLVIANKLRRLLSEAETSGSESGMESATDASVNVLDIIGVKIGDKVMVGDTKTGILRYCGNPDFAKGQWAGVELNGPVGKNDGSVDGKVYFQCRAKHGIFCPVSKISKPNTETKLSKVRPNSAKHHSKLARVIHAKRSIGGSLPASRLSSRSPSPQSLCKSVENTDIKVGDRVIMVNDDKRRGIARYVGETQFSPGQWIGVELDTECGKNDGSINGVQYFQCQPNYGLFAHPSKFTIENDIKVVSSMAHSRAISASDDAINRARDIHDGDNKNPSEKKTNLSRMTRRLSNSVPDLSTMKSHEKPDTRRQSGIPRFKGPTVKKNTSHSSTNRKDKP